MYVNERSPNSLFFPIFAFSTFRELFVFTSAPSRSRLHPFRHSSVLIVGTIHLHIEPPFQFWKVLQR